MPRRKRCIPGNALPHHATWRRRTRNLLLRRGSAHLSRSAPTQHRRCRCASVHLIAVPERTDSLSILLRPVHGRYAQYYNAHSERTGHLWQNRLFACLLGPGHLWTALAYVERNPLRARLVRRSEEYIWSSAPAHVTGGDGARLLDMEWLFDPFPQAGPFPPDQDDTGLLSLGSLALRDGQQFLKIHVILVAA